MNRSSLLPRDSTTCIQNRRNHYKTDRQTRIAHRTHRQSAYECGRTAPDAEASSSGASLSHTAVGTRAFARFLNNLAASVPQLIFMTSSTHPTSVRNVLQSEKGIFEKRTHPIFSVKMRKRCFCFYS